MTIRRPAQDDRRSEVTAREFRELYDEVSSWGRWGERGDRGALNLLSAERIAAAARCVRLGVTVTLSQQLDTERRIDNPLPAEHRMTMVPDVDLGSGSVRFAKDYIGADYHSEGHSHIDALSHVVYDGRLFDGRPGDLITTQGAGFGEIDILKDGLVGRGVLLDVPRALGLCWLEPGDHVYPEDLLAAEQAESVRVSLGDVLLVRTGHARRRAELEPWDTANGKAGLHPTTARFLAERGVAALGSDGNSDTAPSTTEGVAFPIHVLAINAMGVHLLDYLQFEDLATRCEEAGRWEFLFVAAPLRIAGGTGSPVNPIALF